MDSILSLGVISGIIGILGIAVAVFYVFLVIAYWQIFAKAGQGGWKILIPVYNLYVYYKIAWKGSIFWITLLGTIASALLYYSGSSICTYIAAALAIVVIVLDLITVAKLSRAFGHGFWFTLGLLFLPNIFSLILGFGKSRYLGPQ